MSKKRRVFFVSDRTGITAESLGTSLLTQFDGYEFVPTTFPFINTEDKARSACDFINHESRTGGGRPIIFSTTATDEVRSILRTADALFMDLFETFIPNIELELDASWAHATGRARSGVNEQRYESRIAAMNFALDHDDGQSTRYIDRADVILIAPSRCGKTPTSLYVAMQHGVFAANYPLTPDDLDAIKLPKPIAMHKAKIYGLTNDAKRLSEIRNERRPGSKYASIQQCSYELRQAERLYKKLGIPYTNSLKMSVEEIAALVMQEKGIRRQSF